MEAGGKSMGRRFGRGARGGDVVEQTIDTLLGALIAVEQARDALENVRGRFGRTKRTRHEGRAYGKLGGPGIAVLVLLTIGALAFWLLRRRAREETAPATPAPEEGVEEATPPETEVVAPGPPSAEDVPQGRHHLRVRNAPRGAGLRLRHRQPPEKNHRRARSAPEEGNKGQLCSDLLPTAQP